MDHVAAANRRAWAAGRDPLDARRRCRASLRVRRVSANQASARSLDAVPLPEAASVSDQRCDQPPEVRDRCRDAEQSRRISAGAALGTAFALAVEGVIAFTGAAGGSLRAEMTFTLTVGLAFIGTGSFATLRRPDSRVGPLMVRVGLLGFVATLALSANPYVFSVGSAFMRVFWAAAFHLLLAFPSGRLQTRLDRLLVGVMYVDAALVMPTSYLFVDTSACPVCPRNVFQLFDEQALPVPAFLLALGILVAAGLVAAVRMGLRWRRAAPSARRSLGPAFVAGMMLTAFVLATVPVYLLAVESSRAYALATATVYALLASVPIAFLIGVMRSRLDRAAAVGSLIERLRHLPSPQALGEALADAVGDPHLSIAYWRADNETWVDARGRSVSL